MHWPSCVTKIITIFFRWFETSRFEARPREFITIIKESLLNFIHRTWWLSIWRPGSAPWARRGRPRFEKEAESIKNIAKLGNGEVLRLNLWCIATPWQTVQMLCMSVDLNVIHISTNRCHCMNEWMSKKVTGLKRRQRDGFSGLHSSCRQSLYHPQNPLHNLYETGLSSASSIGIIWGIKPVAILV